MIKKIMIIKKNILVTLCFFSLILFSSSQAETITFDSSIYEGEVKKEKHMAREFLLFQMKQHIKENLKKINLTE